MTINRSALARLLTAGALFSILAVLIWHPGVPSSAAQGGFEGAILTVTPNAGQSFDLTALPVGPFSVEGTIETVGTGGTGTFRRSGTKLSSGFAIVNDVYELTSHNGAIMAQGTLKGAVVGLIEQADLLAVSGGVGTFRGASGEMQLKTIDASNGAFRAFLEETPRRRRSR
ncbi:MAG TPA: hypothetical protein VJH03_23075 [Blastocatellia bacterium]|nr:hypothetical protein [Blastocatellia bacterium]